MRTGRRASLVATTLVVLGLISLGGAALAQYTGTLAPNALSYRLGASGTATGTNLDANASYTLDLGQNPTAALDTATTNASGTATFAFTIPTTGFATGAAFLHAHRTTGTGAEARRNITLLAAQATATPTATPGAARLVPNKNSYRAGEAGTATGTNLTGTENYHLDFIQSPGILLDRRNTNAVGTVTFAFRIPTNARNGGATLRAHPTDNTGLVATASITITAGAAGGVTLPKTGAAIATYIGIGILLILLGWAMIAYVRRRRRAYAEARRQLSEPTESTRV